MSQLFLKSGSIDSEGRTIAEEIKNAFVSDSGIVDDLYLTFHKSELNDANDELMRLYEQQKIRRHHIEFSGNCNAEEIERCDSTIFHILHAMTNLQAVKLNMAFETSDNIDSFYDRTVIRAFIQQSPHLSRIILYSPLTSNALQHFRSKYVSEIETLVQIPLTIYVRPNDESVVDEHFGLVLLKSLSSVEESQFESEDPFYVKRIKKIHPMDGEL